MENDTALALNRYLCNAVLPLLTSHAYYFAGTEHHAALLDTTLHTVGLLSFISNTMILTVNFENLPLHILGL